MGARARVGAGAGARAKARVGARAGVRVKARAWARIGDEVRAKARASVSAKDIRLGVGVGLGLGLELGFGILEIEGLLDFLRAQLVKALHGHRLDPAVRGRVGVSLRRRLGGGLGLGWEGEWLDQF